jgi:hypothetical protein
VTRPEKDEPLDLIGTASGKAAGRYRAPRMRDDRDFRHAMLVTNEVGCPLDLPARSFSATECGITFGRHGHFRIGV